MIQEYNRPVDLAIAVGLLSRQQPHTIALGGGTVISRMANAPEAVVDLQSLPLNRLEVIGHTLAAGATVTLEQLLAAPEIQPALQDAIRLEATLNTRNVATVAGTIVAGNGESPFLACLLAMDARLTWLPGDVQMSIGDYLPLREAGTGGKLITRIDIPTQAKLSFTSIGRSPMDKPLVCVSVANWPSGRTRIVLGGLCPAPVLALDGTDAGGAEEALINACSQLFTQWVSKNYLLQATKTLYHRLISA
jgi:CO/xanthine dehydrogenase FAD-binding subunit